MRCANARDASTNLRIVHQRQRLQRRVRARAAHDAILARRRIEEHHVRRRALAFPIGVEAAAILALACVRHVFLRVVERDRFPQARRLIRLHALPADVFDQQAADDQRRVAHALRHPRGSAGRARASDSPDRARATRGVTFDDCRYVADVTISLCICFTSQPLRTNSVASQSSNSGCDGMLALHAEILRRLHQARAEVLLPEAIHRHARGERMLRINQPLREAQPVGRRVLRASGGRIAGTPGPTLSPFLSYSPRISMNVSRGFSISFATIVVGIAFSNPSFSSLHFSTSSKISLNSGLAARGEADAGAVQRRCAGDERAGGGASRLHVR